MKTGQIINVFIRSHGMFQDLLLHRSRKIRAVAIMKQLTNDPTRVDDILHQRFSPLTGEIHPGVSCGPIKCRFCYNADVDNQTGNILKPIDYVGKEDGLAWDEIKAVVDDYIESGVKEIYVAGGKEPWLSGKFIDSDKTTVDLIRYIRSRSEAVIISMLSIGLPLRDPRVREAAVECMNIVRISLDAANPERYDYLKGLTSESGSGNGTSTGTFDRIGDYVRETLKLRNSYGTRSRLRIGFSFLCYEDNYAQLEGFLELAQRWGVDFVDIKGMLANPDSDKIEGFMNYVCSVYDRVLMGEYKGLDVYFHEIFFRNIGRRYGFDKELLKSEESVPDKCFLALSGIRTTVVIPNGKAFVCVNSSQPGYDSRHGQEWDKYRLGRYEKGAKVRGLVERHKEASGEIEPQRCKHGTSTDESLNLILEKLRLDNEAGYPLDCQPISPDPDDLYYDGRAIYHKGLSQGKRGRVREFIAAPLFLPEKCDSAVEVDSYVRSRLPVDLVEDVQRNSLMSIEILSGSYSENHVFLESLTDQGAIVVEVKTTLRSPTNEQFHKVINKDGTINYIISTHPGRIRRFLSLLNYLNIKQDTIKVREYDSDWLSVYQREISSATTASCNRAVICANPEALAEQMQHLDPSLTGKEIRGDNVRFVVLGDNESQVILIELLDAYSTQISTLLQYLILPRNYGGLGINNIQFVGETGGTAANLNLGDIIVPNFVCEEDGMDVSFANNLTVREIKPLLPLGKGIRIHEGAIETIPTILSESRKRAEQQGQEGILGVELELAHAVRVIEYAPHVQFGAFLQVVDLPNRKGLKLGEVKLTTPEYNTVLVAKLIKRK